ncbi:MAG: hypothetical protein JWN84_1548 [Nocardioides sp.]|jgi:hypothetical protein|nr:hypothetical protein [Nocardioides sp.]
MLSAGVAARASRHGVERGRAFLGPVLPRSDHPGVPGWPAAWDDDDVSEQPGRYNRSFEGLIGAMIIIVLMVLAFVVYRGIFRDPPETELGTVDYRDEVLGLQSNDVDVVYPDSLPEGWRATEVRYVPSEQPRFELNFFTDDDNFVGLRQVEEDVEDLLEAAGIEEPREEDPLTGDAAGDVVTQWDAWSDPDGDHAYSAEVGGRSVLVYGSVSAADLADLVGRLTDDALPTPAPSPTPS